MKPGFHELRLGALVKALSADGSTVVGHFRKEDGENAFRWTQRERLVDLGPSVAHDVSADGSVVVGESSNRACRWRRDAVREIVGTQRSSASAVSHDGSVIASIQDLRAVRWTTQGVQRLGWLQEHHEAAGAYGISGDGRVIVGTADAYDRTMKERASRWTGESGMVALSEGGGFPYFFSSSCATAASYDGRAIVRFVGDVGVSERGVWNQPFRWKRGRLLRGSMRCLGYPTNIVKPGRSHALLFRRTQEGGRIHE
jgi:uncharacterized membrane protein